MNERGERDTTCLELLHTIERNCHALVIDMGECWERYTSQIRTLERQGILLVPGIMKLIKSLVVNQEKDMKYPSGPDLREVEGLDEMPGVDVGDRAFVKAATSVAGSILVTTDAPLATAMRVNAIESSYGFRVLSPQEALALAAANT